MSVPPQLQSQIDAHERAHADERKRLRTLSMEERAQMVSAVCRTAAHIYAARLAAGYPPVRPQPFPASTLEFFKRQMQQQVHG